VRTKNQNHVLPCTSHVLEGFRDIEISIFILVNVYLYLKKNGGSNFFLIFFKKKSEKKNLALPCSLWSFSHCNFHSSELIPAP
jgi:hypothetical protein